MSCLSRGILHDSSQVLITHLNQCILGHSCSVESKEKCTKAIGFPFSAPRGENTPNWTFTWDKTKCLYIASYRRGITSYCAYLPGLSPLGTALPPSTTSTAPSHSHIGIITQIRQSNYTAPRICSLLLSEPRPTILWKQKKNWHELKRSNTYRTEVSYKPPELKPRSWRASRGRRSPQAPLETTRIHFSCYYEPHTMLDNLAIQ